jgi:hypothetical protein
LRVLDVWGEQVLVEARECPFGARWGRRFARKGLGVLRLRCVLVWQHGRAVPPHAPAGQVADFGSGI